MPCFDRRPEEGILLFGRWCSNAISGDATDAMGAAISLRGLSQLRRVQLLRWMALSDDTGDFGRDLPVHRKNTELIVSIGDGWCHPHLEDAAPARWSTRVDSTARAKGAWTTVSKPQSVCRTPSVVL